jgi:hypothetical protein
MTVANLTGIPYSISLRGEPHLAHNLMAHADYMRFALAVNGGVENPPVSRPDEIALATGSALSWDILRAAAMATSAFPLAFKSRALSRGSVAAGYRAIAIPSESGDAEIVQLIPRWDVLMAEEPNPAVANFVNVDGGTFNNEPIDLVRTSLAGLNGRNPRKSGEADRAVILIDPFSDPDAITLRTPPSLTGLLGPFIFSLVNQARYKPTDIALARDEDVFSRFLIAPVGPGPNNQKTEGMKAIASGGLGGFLGFIHPDFARYDFALGRQNGWSFLSRHLAIPRDAGNPIFNSWTDDHVRAYQFEEDGCAYLPIIPLMPSVASEPALHDWPTLDKVPDLDKLISQRLDTVYKILRRQTRPGSWAARLALTAALDPLWKTIIRKSARNAVVDRLIEGLNKWQLIARNSTQ